MTKLTLDTEINLAGVMGYPITHSRSPLMHNTLMKENDVRGVYIPIEIKPGTLGPALESLPKLGFKGVNLTMPLKQEAIATVDELDPAGKLMGAVSCIVVRRDNSLLGVNNDWIGFRDNLHAAFPGWKSTTQSALVLGAGGGGLAIVYALIQEGVKEIVITNRSQERAEKVAAIFKDQNILVRPWSDRHSLVEESDLIVNTTNQGMAGQTPLGLSLELAKPDAIVADIIYVPLETDLIRDAKSRGLRTTGGLGMLLHQSRPAWQLWFGIDPQITSHLRTAMERDITEDV
ncbi:shikimate dehydrogenase [Litoricola sp.]|nr:shikimate dehydrogenase [Litorivicinus sp.]